MAEDEEEINTENTEGQDEPTFGEIIPISGLYENWFLEYASYVILERAVPAMEDGLKPVQRRILHAMNEMDDGRFNKVANIIGQTMQFHPHGDAAIGESMVNLGQKELLIETQGNWGDVRTGDSAAAPRYIEARLSKFALDVAFNPSTTEWQLSYDGRKQEPVTLPMKFPLLLAQGVEGIAVGLATKIMPHNFIELIQASVNLLKEKEIVLYPDFLTGGMIDVTNYNQGKRGGKIRIRARIEEFDKKTLLIKEIPYFTTTTSIIESIIKAGDAGKIKIRKVVDNTAKDVEIAIHLAPGASPDITVDALYAFTECEISISPNACVIVNEKPHFVSVNEILRISTQNTVNLLRQELEIKLNNLSEAWHFSSLERIFIENKIYRKIEECETWEAVIEAIDKGLKPFKKQLKREVTRDDIIRLTEIRIKRISKFDSFKADEEILGLETQIGEVQHHLAHLTQYAISYFEGLLKKYGKGKERKTEIRTFDTIEAKAVAIANMKLYMNKDEGFIGTGLKKDEFVCDCSDIDDIIVFRRDGKMTVVRVADKVFVGKDIIHVGIYRKSDDHMTYHMVYADGKSGISMVKRFNVGGITRDKEYDLTKGTPGSKVLYFTANPEGESEVITINLSPYTKARKLSFDFDFGTVSIKGRNSQGNILCKYLIKNIKQASKGLSTFGGRRRWLDESIGRLNTDERGKYLGVFSDNDLILAIYKDGTYELTGYDLTKRFEPEQFLLVEKFYPGRTITAVYFDGASKLHYAKRFVIETQTTDKKFLFISESKGSYLELVTTGNKPVFTILKGKNKANASKEAFDMEEYVEVRGWKAVGNKIGGKEVLNIELTSEEPHVEDSNDGGGESGGGADALIIPELEDLKLPSEERGKKKEVEAEPVQPRLF